MTLREKIQDASTVLITLAILLCFVFPFVWVVLTSIRPDSELFTKALQLFPKHVTFAKYKSLLGSQFLRYILNSIFVATTSTFVTIVVSIFAAYSFSRYRFRGKGPLLGVFAFSQLFPFVVLLTPLYIFFYKLHLVNTYVGLIIAYTAITLPFCVYMLLGYFQSVPVSLDEAALIDGCSTSRVIFRIVLPVAWPGIVATAVYVFIQSWNEYLFALTFMTDEQKKTIPVGLANFFGQYTTDWGSVMSASVIATVPTLVFFLFMQKQLVSGLAAGSVKQ
ncbi:MAG TPA: carbohydrate ABC transporter permease [Spirochaetia bacterium]|nr:carbohydrate ABC transporter permease [Spirochaetia bacterium]